MKSEKDKIRECFVKADPDQPIIIQTDFNQIEMRIMAEYGHQPVVRSINEVRWGNRVFLLIDHFKVEISPDPDKPGWIRARHTLYPPISGNGYDNQTAWDRWRQDFAVTYDKALEGKLDDRLSEAILGMVKAVAIEHRKES